MLLAVLEIPPAKLVVVERLTTEYLMTLPFTHCVTDMPRDAVIVSSPLSWNEEKQVLQSPTGTGCFFVPDIPVMFAALSDALLPGNALPLSNLEGLLTVGILSLLPALHFLHIAP